MSNIKESRNYDIFELADINREIGKTAALFKSMKQYGWIDAYPMHVFRSSNGKLKIKAGHHRFFVASKLGIPVKYVICNDSASITELETSTRKWSMQDYLTSYVRQGKPSYITLKNYCQSTGIKLTQGIALLGGRITGNGLTNQQFKEGKFEVIGEAHARAVAEIIVVCNTIFEDATSSRFVHAISLILSTEGVSRSQLMRKLKSHSYLLKKQATTEAYIDLLDSIYNRSAKDKEPIAFWAKEKMRERKQPYFQS